VAFLEYTDPATSQLAVLDFDACLDESVDGSADVTEHPVEQGANISDHKRPQPRQIQITVTVANNPVKIDPAPILTYRAANNPPRFDAYLQTTIDRKGDTARDVLEQLRLSGDPVAVILGNGGPCSRRYENMELVKLTMPRDVHTGDCLKASLGFKEILIAVSQTVAVPKSNLPAAQATANLGKQPTTPASTANAANAGSTLHQVGGNKVTGAITGFFQ
jgi:hypothetical protein